MTEISKAIEVVGRRMLIRHYLASKVFLICINLMLMKLFLVSKSGKPMKRVPDLIDVWFDSGAMPYAQWHFPFENKETFKQSFPCRFYCEGVDQTRGWFYTLHAIACIGV